MMLRRFDSTAIIFGIATLVLLGFSLFVTFRLEQPVIGICLMVLFVFDVAILMLLLRTPKPRNARRALVDEPPQVKTVAPKKVPMVADDPDELDPDEYPDYLR